MQVPAQDAYAMQGDSGLTASHVDNEIALSSAMQPTWHKGHPHAAVVGQSKQGVAQKANDVDRVVHLQSSRPAFTFSKSANGHKGVHGRVSIMC